MNKNVFKKAILVAILASVTVFSVSALEAQVLSVKGKVEVQQGNNWVAVKVGDTIAKGAVISTGFKSEAILKVKESKFTLAPLTRITIEQLASTEAKDETQLYVDSGNVSFNVKKSDNKKVGFKVRSPVATASVRGTEGSLSSNGDATVLEGLVSYGPAESSSPQVVENDSSFIPAAGTSNALTPTTDVSGKRETPLYAGQTSATDTLTGERAAPQNQMMNNAHGEASNTRSLASEETPDGGMGGPTGGFDDNRNGIQYGTVTVTLQWE